MKLSHPDKYIDILLGDLEHAYQVLYRAEFRRCSQEDIKDIETMHKAIKQLHEEILDVIKANKS